MRHAIYYLDPILIHGLSESLPGLALIQRWHGSGHQDLEWDSLAL